MCVYVCVCVCVCVCMCLSVEERLRDAELSLKQLDRAVQNQTPNIENEIRDEMAVNVQKLKRNCFQTLPRRNRKAKAPCKRKEGVEDRSFCLPSCFFQGFYLPCLRAF